jgi:hypothetical protein
LKNNLPNGKSAPAGALSNLLCFVIRASRSTLADRSFLHTFSGSQICMYSSTEEIVEINAWSLF